MLKTLAWLTLRLILKKRINAWQVAGSVLSGSGEAGAPGAQDHRWERRREGRDRRGVRHRADRVGAQSVRAVGAHRRGGVRRPDGAGAAQPVA